MDGLADCCAATAAWPDGPAYRRAPIRTLETATPVCLARLTGAVLLRSATASQCPIRGRTGSAEFPDRTRFDAKLASADFGTRRGSLDLYERHRHPGPKPLRAAQPANQVPILGGYVPIAIRYECEG